MRLKLILPFTIALACFASVSVAQERAVQTSDAGKRAASQASFASVDDDRDGAITRTEASEKTQLLVDFDRIDLDRDDKLEPAEYASFYSAGYGASK
jgi:hypothetical protein